MADKLGMTNPDYLKYTIASWPDLQARTLNEWRHEIDHFCELNNIFSREELLRGKAFGVWGTAKQLALFKLFFG